MINEIFEYQRRELEQHIQAHTDTLVRGTTDRDEDQRVRGIIHGLRKALSVLDVTYERARKAARDAGYDE